MKKSIFSMILSILIICSTSIQTYATELFEPEVYIVTQEEHLANGDLLITTIYSESLQSSLFRASVVNGTKSVEYQNSNHETLWTFSVSGTFSINGSNVSCTNATHSITIHVNGWESISKSSYASNNTANASVRMGYYSWGIIMQSIDKSLILTCDSNGNLS